MDLITDSPQFDVRYSLPEDEVFLRQWMESEGMLHWFPVSEPAEVENAIKVWMAFCRFKAGLTATFENQPCGMGVLFLMPYRKVAHHCLFKLIVDPRQQRRGVGTALVRNLKHLAKQYFNLELIHTEVFEGNPFIDLLNAAHFREYARQERYVKEGNDYFARILMECDL